MIGVLPIVYVGSANGSRCRKSEMDKQTRLCSGYKAMLNDPQKHGRPVPVQKAHTKPHNFEASLHRLPHDNELSLSGITIPSSGRLSTVMVEGSCAPGAVGRGVCSLVDKTGEK